MGTGIQDMEKTIDELIKQWVAGLRTRQSCTDEAGKAVDLGVSIQYLTVDVISKLSLGKAFGCMDNNSDRFDFLGSVRQGMSASLMLSVLPEVVSWLYHLTKWSPIHRLLVPAPTDKSGFGFSLGVSQAVRIDGFPLLPQLPHL